jgi:hypothetical protein
MFRVRNLQLPPGGILALRNLVLDSKKQIDKALEVSSNNFSIKVSPEFVVHFVGWLLASCYVFSVQGRVGPFQKLTLNEGIFLS